MITLANITLSRSGQHLFQDFNWKINDGENWVITGPNGSGKTILLEMLAGLIHIPVGEIKYSFINGATWDQRHLEKSRAIKFIPTNAIQTIIPDGSSLYYQQRYYAGESEIGLVKNIFGDALKNLKHLKIPSSLSIEHLLELPITRLSNGQLKKILLMKNLASEIPRLLLLDYPFEGLDPKSREDLCLFLDFVHLRHNVQIILTDHHHQIPSVIKKRLILNEFKILEEQYVEGHAPVKSLSIKLKPEALSNTEKIVDLKNVTIKYGDKTIIDKLNWTVCKGERWALIGRNGAGKTTLFSMIFADHPHGYSQEIYLFGRRRGTGESIWDIKKRIGYLGPEIVTYLNFKAISLSAREYLKNHHPKLNILRLDNLISFFQAENFIEKPVRTLSSGQLQLLQIILCLVSDKELLLLDEPFQFLDDGNANLLREYLRMQLDRQTTMILITHYERDIVDWTENTLRL